MGSSVQAKCTNCDYENNNILIGRGMRMNPGYCLHPAMCQGCKNIVNVDVLGKSPKCPDCSTSVRPYYSDPSLQQVKGSRTVEEWDDIALNNGKYLCPKCHEFHLEFKPGGLLWD